MQIKSKSIFLFRFLALFLSLLLFLQQSGFSQLAAELDISTHLATLRNSLIVDKFRPLHLRYLEYNLFENNFRLLIDKGSLKSPSQKELEDTSKQLLKYFFTGLSLPNDKFWVNLRPDSPDDIIDPLLAQTDIGKIFLEADLQLKKDTAQATNPQTPEGKLYWDRLYKKAEELFGSENITIPTLTRPWIVPDEIIIRETMDSVYSEPGQGPSRSAYIYKATLKVMLEQDYLKNDAVYNFQDPRLKKLNEYSSQLIRELIIPKLTQQINTSKKYASLRQVYYSLILAQWFKARNQGRKDPYSKMIDCQDLTGLTSKEYYSKESYFKQYQNSFKEGEYNLQEPVYTAFGQSIRSYFSGGVNLGNIPGAAILIPGGPGRKIPELPNTRKVGVEFIPANGEERPLPIKIVRRDKTNEEPTPQKTTRRGFLGTFLAAVLGIALPTVTTRLWSSVQDVAEGDFYNFVREAAMRLSFNPQQTLPRVSFSEARNKAEEVMRLFNDFEARIKTLTKDNVEGEFEDFYWKLLQFLPPEYSELKIRIIKNKRFSDQDIKELYLKLRDYLLNFRILIVYKRFHELGLVSEDGQTKIFRHYSFYENPFYIEEIFSNEVVLIRPILGDESFFKDDLGKTFNGCPVIFSDSLKDFISFLEEGKSLEIAKVIQERTFKDLFLNSAFPSDALGYTSFSALDGQRAAAYFSLLKLVTMKEKEGLEQEIKKGVAYHERQHQADFLSPRQSRLLQGLSPLQREARLELRGYLAELFLSPWSGLVILVKALKDKDESVHQQVKIEICNAIIKVILDNPESFAKIIEPLDEQLWVKFGSDDYNRINIISQLYKFSLPEYAQEFKMLVERLREFFGFDGLIAADEAGVSGEAKDLKSSEEQVTSKASDYGGIDLTGLAERMQIRYTFYDKDFLRMQGARRFDLDREWDELKKMALAGIIPQEERLKECIFASYASGEYGRYFEDAFFCVATILRKQEDDCSVCSLSLRHILEFLEMDVILWE